MANDTKKKILNKIFICLTIFVAILVMSLAVLALLKISDNAIDLIEPAIVVLLLLLGILNIKIRRVIGIIYFSSSAIIFVYWLVIYIYKSSLIWW